MSETDHEQPRFVANRMAVAVVVASLLFGVALVVLYSAGLLDSLVPARPPAADAIPLYLLGALLGVALLVWGWQRLISLFQ